MSQGDEAEIISHGDNLPIAQQSFQRESKTRLELGYELIATAKKGCRNRQGGTDDRTVFALDSTTIDLCLSVFDWALFRKAKGAIKVHTLLDVNTGIPDFIRISTGKMHDVNILDELVFQSGAYYVMDKAYNDFRRLYQLHLAGSFFVIRAKKNSKIKRIRSQSIDKTTGVRCDQIVRLVTPKSRRDCPIKIRCIKYFDADQKRCFVFLTNDFSLPALTIAKLYKQRWQVELFFKWIKQNLRIKSFYGQSENAVRCQVWIAICVYALIAIMREELKIDRPMSEIVQIFSAVQFENIPINALFDNICTKDDNDNSNKTPYFPQLMMGH